MFFSLPSSDAATRSQPSLSVPFYNNQDFPHPGFVSFCERYTVTMMSLCCTSIKIVQYIGLAIMHTRIAIIVMKCRPSAVICIFQDSEQKEFDNTNVILLVFMIKSKHVPFLLMGGPLLFKSLQCIVFWGSGSSGNRRA